MITCCSSWSKHTTLYYVGAGKLSNILRNKRLCRLYAYSIPFVNYVKPFQCFILSDSSRKRLDSGSPERSDRKRSRRSPLPPSSRGRVSPAAGRSSKRRNDSTGSEERKTRDDKSPIKDKGEVHGGIKYSSLNWMYKYCITCMVGILCYWMPSILLAKSTNLSIPPNCLHGLNMLIELRIFGLIPPKPLCPPTLSFPHVIEWVFLCRFSGWGVGRALECYVCLEQSGTLDEKNSEICLSPIK